MDKKRTFLLGAGFSKEIADGPLQTELWQKFEESYQHVVNRIDVPEEHKKNRISWFNKLNEFIKKLEIFGLKRFSKIAHEYESIETEITNNIEYILTLIDLHISNNVQINFNRTGVDTEPYPFIPLEFTDKKEIEQIRGIINTFLFLSLNKLTFNEKAIKFAKNINDNDDIITFNYDISLEKALFNLNRWYPLHGYAGLNKFEIVKDEDELKQKGLISPIDIHKLHGSINWRAADILGKEDLSKEYYLVMDDIENQSFYFNCIEKRNPQTSGGYYVGVHNAAWLLPSFIKPFQNITIFDIWRSALSVLSKTEELVVIGYSLRAEDSNSFLLLGNLNKDARIIVVDKRPDKIKEMLVNIGFNNIYTHSTFSDYIESLN